MLIRHHSGKECDMNGVPETITPEVVTIVKRIASQVYRKSRQFCGYDDLVQEGLLAAHLKMKDYDSNQGQLDTFIQQRVRGAMIDYLRKTNWFGSSAARGTGYAAGLRISQMVLGNKIRGSGPEEKFRKHWEPALPEEEPSSPPEEEFLSFLNSLSAGLTTQEKTVLVLYFCRQLDQSQIGEVIGKSASRVSLIFTQALAIIRAKQGVGFIDSTNVRVIHGRLMFSVKGQEVKKIPEPVPNREPRTCICGGKIEPKETGRPPQFCSKECCDHDKHSFNAKRKRYMSIAQPQPEFRPGSGDTVILYSPEETFVHGHLATVLSTEEWGAHVAVHRPAAEFDQPGHQPRWRALWTEMRPNGKPKAIESDDKAVARAKGYTGDICIQCQGCRMVRNGACLRCEDCGQTTGCG